MKATKKIKGSDLSVGMIIVGQKCNSLNSYNEFKVKHVSISSDGKFIRYKADKVNPVYENYDNVFSVSVNQTITVK